MQCSTELIICTRFLRIGHQIFTFCDIHVYLMRERSSTNGALVMWVYLENSRMFVGTPSFYSRPVVKPTFHPQVTEVQGMWGYHRIRL